MPTSRSRLGHPSSRRPMPLTSESSTVEWQSAQLDTDRGHALGRFVEEPFDPDDGIGAQELERGLDAVEVDATALDRLDENARERAQIDLQAQREGLPSGQAQAPLRRWRCRRSLRATGAGHPRSPRSRTCRAGRCACLPPACRWRSCRSWTGTTRLALAPCGRRNSCRLPRACSSRRRRRRGPRTDTAANHAWRCIALTSLSGGSYPLSCSARSVPPEVRGRA